MPDTSETFTHFMAGGWPSVSKAFRVSAAAPDFLSPALIAGVVVDLFKDSQVPDPIKKKLVADLASYAPDGNEDGLRAAAKYAFEKRIPLPLPQIQRIALIAQDPELVLWQVAGNCQHNRSSMCSC